MNVFKTKNSKELELTIENYEEATNKMFPYYNKNSKGKNAYFAICPCCGNPIRIVNLYKEDYIDNNTKRITLHARHCCKSIADIASYNRVKYENCPLHKQGSFGAPIERVDNEYNEYLKSLIENNKLEIRKHIRNILGINFKDDYLDGIISNYLNNHLYCYTHTNEYNIPYSIIITSQALDIYGRIINGNTIGTQLVEAINNNSRYFKVEHLPNNNHKIIKTSKEYININIQLCRHRKHQGIYIATLKMTETFGNTNVIYKTNIEIKPIILSNY